jgi:multicomponent Na+:H+ antiporter subunit D
MTNPLLHPVLPFAVAALIVPWVGVPVRRILSLVAPALALASSQRCPDGATWALERLGHDWVLLRADGLATVFATAFILYALMAGVYAWQDVGRGPKAMSLVLAGAGTGVVLAGDLLTLFFFWEWLTVASLFLIWFGNTEQSWDAGFRYLIFHLAGAIVMLTGILMLLAEGVTTFEVLPHRDHGVVAGPGRDGHERRRAAAPRLALRRLPRGQHLRDGLPQRLHHQERRLRPGPRLPGPRAAHVGRHRHGLLRRVLRRHGEQHPAAPELPHHQPGRLHGDGDRPGDPLSLNGTSAHAFSHIFYKGLLMMSAGAVIHATGRGKLSDLGQLAKPLRWTLVLMMIGALSISGAPLFSGFVSKSMIVSAAAYTEQAPVELILIIVSMGTFLSVALKMPWFTFAGEDRGATVLRPRPRVHVHRHGPDRPGLLRHRRGPRAPPSTGSSPSTPCTTRSPATTSSRSLQLMAGTALGFWFLRVRLVGKAKTTLDTDYLYRRPLAWARLRRRRCPGRSAASA